jgi:hypothetical protein
MNLPWKFSQQTHRIHSIGPKTHVLGHFGLFRYCTKVDAKLAELVPLTHKFARQSCVRIFRYERTRSTLWDPKLIFWGVSDCFVAAQKSMQNWFRNEWTWSTPLDPKLMFWGVSDRFVTAWKSMQIWLNWRYSLTSSQNEVAFAFLQRPHLIHSIQSKTHVLVPSEPFHYYRKVYTKLAELAPFTHKFAKRSYIRKFREERT